MISDSPVSPSNKQPSPPPPYTEVADAPLPQRTPVDEGVHASSSAPFGSHAHLGFGPTPIAQQAHLLPYYDPRSPHSIAEAGSRARWRFIGAFLWALAIMMLISFVTGYEVHANMQRMAHGVVSFLQGDATSWQS